MPRSRVVSAFSDWERTGVNGRLLTAEEVAEVLAVPCRGCGKAPGAALDRLQETMERLTPVSATRCGESEDAALLDDNSWVDFLADHPELWAEDA